MSAPHDLTSSRSHRRARRLAPAAAGLGLALVGVLATAAPASATDEFPSKPTAVATLACDADVDGPVITLVLGNVGGLSSAPFDVDQTDLATVGFDVAQGSTTTVALMDMLPENQASTVTVTGDDGFTYTETFAVDCTDFTGGVVLNCDGEQPVITATATAIGQLGDEVFLYGSEWVDLGDAHLEPGESTTFTVPVPDDVAFDITLVSDADGTLADLAGTPHCQLPTPSTTSTTIEPEPTTSTTEAVIPADTTTTEPTQVLPQQLDDPGNPYGTPPVASTTLPRTGSSTWPLTGVGTVLLAVGTALRLFVAHQRNRT